MELLTANVVGKVRYATANGKQYLVAPLRLIVPGVLNGSQGALFYPPEECAKNPVLWNHMPLVVYHPQTPTGNHVSARDPDILARQGIGYVWRAHAKKGPLDAEGWFEVEACKRVDNRILTALEQGQQIELSTGLYTDNEPAPAGATYNGRPYTHVARNYQPDHVAILPDQIGACSVQDGCGVLVNAAEVQAAYNGKWTQEQRDKLPEDDFAGPGQSFPIKTQEDVDYAARLIGHASDPDAVKRRIIEIARKKGLVIPDAWKDDSKDTTENRAGLLSRLLDWLTGNTPSLAANASPNQPRHAETGQYLPHGAGTGKGDVHQAAVGGAAYTPPATPSSDALDVPDEEDLSEQDRVHGADARKQKAETGHNPPSWVADEPIWEKAKEAAGKSGKYEEGSDTYWAVVSHIYQQMGGEMKKGAPTANAWSDAAREAALEARKASMKASEKTSGLSMSSRLSSGTIKDVSGHATKAEGLAQKAAGHAEAGRFDKAQSHHEDAARAHMEAYSTLSKSGDFRAHEAAGEHLKAYEAHGNAYMKMAEGQVSNAAADMHDSPVAQAQQLSDRADQHTRGAKDDKTHKAAMAAHEDAAEAHRSAAKASAGDQSGRQMHEQKADYHDAKAGEHRAKCGETPTGNKDTVMTPEQKKILIDSLVANCSCQVANVWTEQDRPALEALSPERLTALAAQKKSLQEKDAELTANRQKQPTTFQEWLAMGPPEAQETFRHAQALEQRERLALVERFVANIKDPEEKKAVAAEVAREPIGRLRRLVQAIPAPQAPAFSGSPSAADPLYLGAATPAFNTADIPDDNSMDPPTLNWAELATENARRHAS